MDNSRLVASRFCIEDLDRDLLGRGGMGEVYRATDTQTGETVAVKGLNPEILERDPHLLERFVREGEALRVLNHPNIVRMIAAVEEQGQHYLVMEYMEGGSLRDMMNLRGCLPANEVVRIALDVADALTRAHHVGIIHRDLKPANVLLAKDGTPRLADFGLAHIQESSDLTQSGVLVGTVDYLSPEGCQGSSPDERSDIWAFGVTLFEMLAGRVPFEGQNLTAKITSILTQAVPDLAGFAPDTPDGLADLVYRMLEKDPQQRIPSVRQVGLELEALLKGWELVAVPRTHKQESRFDTPGPSVGAPKHNLPAQPTAFVGRQAELTELARLLSDPEVRLITILGAGGMGKTRLALEGAAAQLDSSQGSHGFADGVYFLGLAAVSTTESIVPTIATALGFSFHEGPEPRQQLLGYLHEKSMLLILDNFEHLLSGVDLLDEILNSAPQIKILDTSRARLNIQGEQLFRLGGMDFPDRDTPEDIRDYSSVKLFLQSARRVRPEFELTPDNMKYVARICRLVDGMPLGILLAASWLEMLTPEEVAAEIETGLDFLETAQHDVSDRQHSMRAVFDHSWNLLTGGEQAVFKRTSVFRGGFTREAAQTATDGSLRDLMSLVDKSLLQRSPSGRYGIHELLRQYVAEKLAQEPTEEQATRDRHCAYYAEFLQRREGLLFGKGQRAAMSEIEAEIDNIRMGWGWAVEHAQVERLSHYLESLGELYSTRGWSEDGAKLFARAADKLSVVPDKANVREVQILRGRLLLWQGRLSDAFDTAESTNRLFLASVAMFRELGATREIAYALCCGGGSESLYGDVDGEAYCQEGLDLFREIGDKRGIALALRGLAWVALHQGNYPLAKQRFQDSVALLRELGDQKRLARSLGGLGYTCWILGEYQLSKEQHEEMLALCKEIGDQSGIARSLGDLGIDSYGLREYRQAHEFWLASLDLYRQIGDAWGMADELGDLGAGAIAMEEHEVGAQFARQSLALGAKSSRQMHSWELAVLGRAALGMGDLNGARNYLGQSLEISLRIRRWGHALVALVGVAGVLAQEGNAELALELLTLIMSHRASWQMARDQAAPLLGQLEAELPPDIVAAARARGQSRDLEKTIRELLAELQQ